MSDVRAVNDAVEDFLTSDEEEAFQAVACRPSEGTAKDVRDFWFAARAFFTSDTNGKAEPGLPDGYFDQARAQVRLQIMSLPSGLRTEGIGLEYAKKIEAWVFGE